MNVIILGPAGSGKTLLAQKFSGWLSKNRVSNAVINLDPGAESLPYKPLFDIRKKFTTREIMTKNRLGPNGAMMKAMDLLVREKSAIARKINSIDADLKIIDCPGQLEIFVFHEAVKILDLLKKPAIAVFLIPAELSGGRDMIVSEFLSLAVRLRIGIPLVNVISKSDKLRKKSVGSIPENIGLESELVAELKKISESLAKERRMVRVSSLRNRGFEELYSIIHEIQCECGDVR